MSTPVVAIFVAPTFRHGIVIPCVDADDLSVFIDTGGGPETTRGCSDVGADLSNKWRTSCQFI